MRPVLFSFRVIIIISSRLDSFLWLVIIKTREDQFGIIQSGVTTRHIGTLSYEFVFLDTPLMEKRYPPHKHKNSVP